MEIDDKDQDSKFNKRQILKNVFVISIGFTFLFTAFHAVANLQTSLNREGGVGVNSLATMYIAMIVSSLFLPDVIISRLGCKWTMSVSMACYSFYIAANLHAINATMIPSAFLLGLSGAPLWSAQSIYMTQLGIWYAKVTKQGKDGVINNFFGLFFMFLYSTEIWGNLISSSVFSSVTISMNASFEARCGADYCNDVTKNTSANFDQPFHKVYTVCGIYLGCAVAAVIIIGVFLDPIHLDQQCEQRHLSAKLLVSTLRHLCSSTTQALLVPLTLYRGMEAAFIGADYTKAFISCSLGVWNVGYVMICYGFMTAASSFIFGRLVKFVGNAPFFVLAFLVHGGMLITFLFWKPSKDQEIYFYAFAALWGVGNSIIHSQSNALYGCLFTNNLGPAFANYRLWEGTGFVLAYVYSDFLCTNVKIFICLAELTAGMLGYTTVEVLLRRQNNERRNTG